jgi:glutaredoxin-like protein
MECQFCRETRELAEEVTGLTDNLAIEVYDFQKDEQKARELGIDNIPALAILSGDGTDYSIRFYGIPSGYEFVSLLERFELVASGDSGLSDEVRSILEKIDQPTALQVFVTPTCPYCPRAVVTAFRFAVANKHIKASMVEATEFPHLSHKHGVGGVPHTVIGDSEQPMVGAYPEEAAAKMVVAALEKT